MTSQEPTSGARPCMVGLHRATKEVVDQVSGLTRTQIKLAPRMSELYIGINKTDVQAAIKAMLELSVSRINKHIDSLTLSGLFEMPGFLVVRVKTEYLKLETPLVRLTVQDNAGELSSRQSGTHRLGERVLRERTLQEAIAQVTAPEHGSIFERRLVETIHLMELSFPVYCESECKERETA